MSVNRSDKEMRIRTNFLVAGLILCSGLAHTQTRTEQIHNGIWWTTNLDQSTKLGWVIGFVDGSEDVRSNLVKACLKQTTGSTQIPQQRAQYEAAAATCDVNYHAFLNIFKAPNSTMGQIVQGIDQFYADYRNLRVGIDFAVLYAYKDLNGAPQSDLDELVRSARQHTNSNS